MSRYIDEADAKDIDILAFPEASLSGYDDRAKHRAAALGADGPEMESLMAVTRSRRPVVLAGFVEQNPGGLPFMTQAVVNDGKIIGRYRKNTIVDEDALYLAPGETVPVFRSGETTFGIAICSDIGNENVFADCARQGARIVFELAAPGLFGEQVARNWESGFRWWEGVCLEKLTEYSKKFGIWIAVATQTGRTVDEDFPGGGYVFSPQGKRVLATSDWSEGPVYAEIDLATGAVREL
jgi:predicted amidohydrolase